MNNSEKCEDFLRTQSPSKSFSNFNIEACRICLATDTRLYRIQEHSLQTIYVQLTGLSMNPTDRLPEHLCWECTHRLVCCQSLRNKALRSYALMLYILTTAGHLTTTSMRCADRQANDLCSTLTQTDTIYITYGLQTYEVDKEEDDDDDVCIIEDDIQEVHDISKEDISFQEVNANYQNTDANFQEAHGSVRKMKTENEFKFKKEETDSMNEDDDDFLMEDNSNSFNDVDDEPKPKEEVKDVKVKRKKSKTESEPKVTRSNKRLGMGLNTKLLTTINLTFDEQISAFKKRQESFQYKDLPYKCTDCYKGFRYEKLYKDHRILHTDRMGQHVCNICKMHFNTASKQRKHARIHAISFRCKQCAFVTANPNTAKYHEEYHKGTVYQCPQCDRKFTNCVAYKKHVRRRHPSSLCGLCGMSFISARGLSRHMQLKHRFHDRTISEDGPYCDKCEVRFSSQDAFDTHLKQSARHKSKCRRRGPVPQTTAKQERSDPVACDQCDQQLPNYRSYYFHFKRAHPGKNRTRFTRANSRFMCEACGKVYLSMAALQDHSTTHSESKQFECDHCHKAFGRKLVLLVHLRNHEKNSNHSCDECGKRFSNHFNMLRHKMIHTGEKPYECDVCGKRFIQATERQSHMAHVHLGEPWPKRNRGKRTRPTSAAGRKDSVL